MISEVKTQVTQQVPNNNCGKTTSYKSLIATDISPWPFIHNYIY